MNRSFSKSHFRPALVAKALAATILAGVTCLAAAQQRPSNSVRVQRAAMQKLAFLAGRWSGPVTVHLGSGETLHLTQHEDVEFKLDGLVLLVQGKSTGADGKAQFEALATIAYDNATHVYHIRAYHAGHYVDTKLTVFADGFSWAFMAGPAKIVNTAHLTGKGEWQETSEFTVGSYPPQPSVEMLLKREH